MNPEKMTAQLETMSPEEMASYFDRTIRYASFVELATAIELLSSDNFGGDPKARQVLVSNIAMRLSAKALKLALGV